MRKTSKLVDIKPKPIDIKPKSLKKGTSSKTIIPKSIPQKIQSKIEHNTKSSTVKSLLNTQNNKIENDEDADYCLRNDVSGDKMSTPGDHRDPREDLTKSSGEYLQLIADLETERSNRKRLESYTQRLKSEMQTLNLGIDRRSTGKPLSDGLAHLTRPLIQQQQKQSKIKHMEESMVNRTPLLEAAAITLNHLQEEKMSRSEKYMEKSREELEHKQVKINELENGNRLLEVRCAALELEMADLKASNNSLTVKVDELEKENADLRTELNDEVRIHFEEIEQLSNETQIATRKAEETEKKYTELKLQIDEDVRIRSNEDEEKDNAVRSRNEQHDIVTKQMIQLKRKDDFIKTMVYENEILCQKNKEMERNIEAFNKEGNITTLTTFNADEWAKYNIKFFELTKNFEHTKDLYQTLLTIRNKEIDATRMKEKQIQTLYDKMNLSFNNKTEKLKSTLIEKNKENSLLREENEVLKKKFERYQSDDKYFSYISSAEEDGEADTEKCINILNI